MTMHDSPWNEKFIAESRFRNILMSNKHKSRHASEKRGKDIHTAARVKDVNRTRVWLSVRDEGGSTWQDKLYRT